MFDITLIYTGNVAMVAQLATRTVSEKPWICVLIGTHSSFAPVTFDRSMWVSSQAASSKGYCLVGSEQIRDDLIQRGGGGGGVTGRHVARILIGRLLAP